jgi:hypothetical protein
VCRLLSLPEFPAEVANERHAKCVKFVPKTPRHGFGGPRRVARGSVFEPKIGNGCEDELSSSSSTARRAPTSSVLPPGGDVEAAPGGGWLVGLRMLWNALALTSGPLLFALGIFWFLDATWWQGLAALAAAPLLGTALIATATWVENLRGRSAITPPPAILLWVETAASTGRKANSRG